MGFFSRFEDKAEGVIEGTSGRGGIEPVKIAKRAAKEMEREKMVGVGHEYAPTLYNVLVAPEDDERMSGYYPSLAGEVETYLTSSADRGGLVFDCPPLVRFIVDEGLKRGKFDIIAESVSPAIISELRHEEMVHYGIEDDVPMSRALDYDDPYDSGAYADEPEPFTEEEEHSFEPDRAAHAPESRPAAPAGAAAERKYPPTHAPAAYSEGTGNAAERTVMIDEAPSRPRAALLNCTTQQHCVIEKDRTTLGRERTCDIVIPDPSVSRHHAEILHNETGWLIRDTGSTNGTTVNGTQATQVRIYNGDIIDLGNTKLEFQED